jgi:glyoxylase-like metal-dependent hydrolase (beta-lactamase superfamily II)
MLLTSRCYAVTGLGYLPPWAVNAGFVVGARVTLVVDSGPSTAAARTIHGYAAAVRPSNGIRVVNTEKHFDHVCGNGFFASIGAEIWAHPLAVRTEAEFLAEIEEFNRVIPDPVRRARGEAGFFFLDTALANPSYTIDCDTTIDLGDCPVQILLTPGHTLTNLTVWVPDARVAYTGDSVVAGYLPNLDSGGPADWRAWLDSLRRIERLDPDMLVPGHGPVLRGGEIAPAIESVRLVLQEAIARGISPTYTGAA